MVDSICSSFEWSIQVAEHISTSSAWRCWRCWPLTWCLWFCSWHEISHPLDRDLKANYRTYKTSFVQKSACVIKCSSIYLPGVIQIYQYFLFLISSYNLISLIWLKNYSIWYTVHCQLRHNKTNVKNISINPP